MFVESIKIAKSAMFPIFSMETISESSKAISVVGTGFFINSDGYFVSAAHVFDKDGKKKDFMYFGRLPDNIENHGLEIKEICRDDAADIYVGKIELKTPGFFHLSDNISDIGRSICVSGYPLAEIIVNKSGNLQLGGVRRYFQPTFILDFAEGPSSSNSGKTRKHKGFLARDVGLFGMSGGPVFDVHGTVLGMQGSVTPPRVSTNGNRTISVENALIIGSNFILDVLKKNKTSTN